MNIVKSETLNDNSSSNVYFQVFWNFLAQLVLRNVKFNCIYQANTHITNILRVLIVFQQNIAGRLMATGKYFLFLCLLLKSFSCLRYLLSYQKPYGKPYSVFKWRRKNKRNVVKISLIKMTNILHWKEYQYVILSFQIV